MRRHSTPGNRLVWRVYPVPTRDLLTVSFEVPVAAPLRLELLDLLGRVVYRGQMAQAQSELQISVGDLPAGTYFLRLLDAQGQSGVRKVVVE